MHDSAGSWPDRWPYLAAPTHQSATVGKCPSRAQCAPGRGSRSRDAVAFQFRRRPDAAASFFLELAKRTKKERNKMEPSQPYAPKFERISPNVRAASLVEGDRAPHGETPGERVRTNPSSA